MTQILKQSTGLKVVIGPVVAVGDGFTPVTTLSLSTADEAEILKHDAAAVTDISAATFAAISSADGYYNLTLTTSHTDTVGLMTILINDDSLCLPVRATFQIVEEAVYDALFAASAPAFGTDNKVLVSTDAQDLSTTLDVNTKTLTASSITATAIATDAITNAKIAADAIGSSELATTAVNEIRDSIISDATTFAGANIDATVSSRATPAQVNTEVLDVMNTDTFAEPGQGAPAATATIFTKINYLYKAWRNKVTQTSTEYKLYADDTTTVDQKATVSDDATTYTSGEVGTGP